MSVAIRLKKLGAKKRPFYRIIVIDSRSARDGQAIEEIGFFHPINKDDNQLNLNLDKARSWLEKGAQPTPTVKKLFNKSGISVRK